MRFKLLATLGLIFLAALLSPGRSAFAHPHVWVTVETEVDFGPNKEIVGFKHKWTFDEFYTQFAVEGLDTNNDGVYSEEELKPLAQTNVEALKEFEYFTFPFVGKDKVALKEPVDYRLEYKDKLLTLYFTLPLALRSVANHRLARGTGLEPPRLRAASFIAGRSLSSEGYAILLHRRC